MQKETEKGYIQLKLFVKKKKYAKRNQKKQPCQNH